MKKDNLVNLDSQDNLEYKELDPETLMLLFEELDNALIKIETLLETAKETRKSLNVIHNASSLYNINLADIASRYVEGEETILNDEIASVIAAWVILEDAIKTINDTSIRIIE